MLGPLKETAFDNIPVSTAAAAGLAQLPGRRGIPSRRDGQSTLVQHGLGVRTLMRSNLARPLSVAPSELASQGECMRERAAISQLLAALTLPKTPAKTSPKTPAKAQPGAPSKEPPPARKE